MSFSLKIGRSEERPETSIVLQGEAARRYRSAFLSYASPHRSEVMKRAQALKAARISFFQDVLSLEPGERWERRLFAEIDRCDLFLLFWSSNTAQSKFVLREVEYALERWKVSTEQMPEIIPLILEAPPVPPPPDELKDIHFNDVLHYAIAAEQRAG